MDTALHARATNPNALRLDPENILLRAPFADDRAEACPTFLWPSPWRRWAALRLPTRSPQAAKRSAATPG